MSNKLSQFYIENVFTCTTCTQAVMNPYLHHNQKHDTKTNMHLNRRKFLLACLEQKTEIDLVFVGEAPGLDGCGYGGIAFTGEYNAIHDLGLDDYHQNQGALQRERSADLIYGGLREFCRQSNIPVSIAARKIYLTNAVLCVPLQANGKSITAPNKTTLHNCGVNLRTQLEIIRPRAVVTLGGNALSAMASAFEFTYEDKLTNMVSRQRQQKSPLISHTGFEIIPEIHPSPRNRVLGSLYSELPSRLVNLYATYIG
ncbi:MAG: hypothetical protein FH749_02275 [Firmicutes bacterium]|nr:hypothetical protein [Bacillota bacterium]